MGNHGTERAFELWRAQFGDRIALRTGRHLVGRALGCDIVLQHPTVSRQHAELVVSCSQVTVRDLSSRNGTSVNQLRVHQAIIRDQDHVRFGAIEFRLEEHPPALVWCIEFDDSTMADARTTAPRHNLPTMDLSPARQRVLDGLLEGLSEKQIAARLRVSVHTIHNQIRDIYRQFRVNSRAELLASFLPRASE